MIPSQLPISRWKAKRHDLARLAAACGRLALFSALMIFVADLASAQTPPTFPPDVTGQRAVTWNYTGLRSIPAVPAVGVHPRVFVGPDQRAEVCNRLTNTVAGRELCTNIIQRYTTLLKNPRSAYDALPSSIKLMPDGSARIGNVGFANEPFIRYTNMVAGKTANLDQMIIDKVAGIGAGDVYARTMAGEMALEALECWVLQGQAGVNQRATNLAVAMDTWSTYLLGRGDFTNSSKSWMLGGGAAFAEAYDSNHWAMTPAQRANVRKALIRCLRTPPYYGVGLAPEAATSNWASLDTFLLIVVMAIEGETSVAVEGYDPAYFGTPNSGTAPLTVSFTDVSNGSGITNRLWNFGDGSTTNTTATNVVHTYALPGTNSVTLTISTASGSASLTRSNYIAVAAPAVPPSFASVIVSGGNLVLSGSGGVPGASYRVLSSPNILLARALWMPVSTNTFALDGAFTNSFPLIPGIPTEFYLLISP